MAWKGNAQGASAKADHWHFIVGLVAVLVVAAGLLLGVWAWSSHVKAESLADCRSQAASAARNVKAYKTDRAAAQRRARAHTPGRRVRRQGRGRRGQGRQALRPRSAFVQRGRLVEFVESLGTAGRPSCRQG